MTKKILRLVIASWILPIINICTIIFLMLVVELTLNENYARGVLGGNQATNNGDILIPGQLLPILIGAFSFLRILYIAWNYGEALTAISPHPLVETIQDATRKYNESLRKVPKSFNYSPLALTAIKQASRQIAEASIQP